MMHKLPPRPMRLYSHPGSRIRRGGFTLIEIMVVVIVLAIVTGAIVPNFSGSMEGARLETAAESLRGLLVACHQAATATGRVHGLILDERGARYRVVAEETPRDERPDEDSFSESSRLVPARLTGFSEQALPEGVRLVSTEFFEEDLALARSGETRILFFPDGTSEFATLTLATARGDRRAVKLNGLSGAVTVLILKDEAKESS